jgi:hypothetical protein
MSKRGRGRSWMGRLMLFQILWAGPYSSRVLA